MDSKNISYVPSKEGWGTKGGLLQAEYPASCFCLLMVRKQNKQPLERKALNSISKF